MQTGTTVYEHGKGLIDLDGNFMHDALDKYKSRFGKQVKFKFQEICAKRISNEPSLGLRSQQQQLLEEFDDEAFHVETTDIKRTFH